MGTQRRALNVLLVDDDEDIFLLIKKALSHSERYKHHITWAPDYKTAQKEITKPIYDVVFLDYALGDGSGFDLLIYAVEEAHISTPIIFLTNYDAEDFDVRVLQLGASDYLVKGDFKLETLERAIRYAMERQDLFLRLQRERNQLVAISKDLSDFINVASVEFMPSLQAIEVEMKKIRDVVESNEANSSFEKIDKALEKTKALMHTFMRLESDKNQQHS